MENENWLMDRTDNTKDPWILRAKVHNLCLYSKEAVEIGSAWIYGQSTFSRKFRVSAKSDAPRQPKFYSWLRIGPNPECLPASLCKKTVILT